MEEIDQYLKMTGQTMQELLAGSEAFGITKIDELVKQCLAENKKIIWKDVPGTIGQMTYSLEDL